MCYRVLGRLRNDDRYGDKKGKKAIGLFSKTIALHVHHAFLYISLPSLHDLASHAGVFWGARISSLPTNACSTEDNIPFPRLANHVVLSKFWKVDLDRKVTR